MPRTKTTSIPRPAGVKASNAGRSRLGDFTRPIPIEKRLWRRPGVAMFAGLSVLIVIGTIAVAVFVLPIGTWRDQDSDLVQRQAQLSELRRVNGELAVETQRLTSPNGIREAAREDYGFVEPGEERASILPLPPLPTKLPAGWPYNVVTEIADAKAVGPAVADETAPSDAAERNGG